MKGAWNKKIALLYMKHSSTHISVKPASLNHPFENYWIKHNFQLHKRNYITQVQVESIIDLIKTGTGGNRLGGGAEWSFLKMKLKGKR